MNYPKAEKKRQTGLAFFGSNVSGVQCSDAMSKDVSQIIRKRPTIGVLQVIQRFGLISSVNSPSSHARAMAASRRVSSW